MAHLEKLTSGALIGILNHNSRKTDNHSNEEIDISKSNLNYSLVLKSKTQKEVLSLAQEHSKRKLRDNINIACSWVVTLPKNVTPDEEQKFFESTHQFLTRRYGLNDNIVSSDVHLDETTPHLHFVFVPLKKDLKTNDVKLSAKEVIDRNELRNFHQDLKEHLDNEFGRSIDVLLEDDEKKLNSIPISDFKSISKLEKNAVYERLARLDRKEVNLNARESTLNARESTLEETHSNLQDEAKKRLETLKKAINDIYEFKEQIETENIIQKLLNFIEVLLEIITRNDLENEVEEKIDLGIIDDGIQEILDDYDIDLSAEDEGYQL